MKHDESSIQRAGVEYFRIQWPHLFKHIQASGNGHFRGSGAAGAKRMKHAKLEGLVTGQSDLFIAVPRGGYAGKYIEIKTPKGKLTKAQEEFLQCMNKVGYSVDVTYGVDALINSIHNYMMQKETGYFIQTKQGLDDEIG